MRAVERNEMLLVFPVNLANLTQAGSSFFLSIGRTDVTDFTVVKSTDR